MGVSHSGKVGLYVLAAWLFCFIGCAPGTVHVRGRLASPRPLSSSTFAVQCQPVRHVVCLVDEDLSNAQCGFVRDAVDAINGALGREILRYEGAAPAAAGPALLPAGFYVVYGDKLPAQTLGQTRTHSESGCIRFEATVLNVSIFTQYRAVVNTVVIHELLHGLGFDHASGAFPSVMQPAVNAPNVSFGLSEGDVNSLRAVYGD